MVHPCVFWAGNSTDEALRGPVLDNIVSRLDGVGQTKTSKSSIRVFSGLETQQMKHFGVLCRPPARPKRPPARPPAHQELQSGPSVRFLGWKLNG